MAFPTGKGQTSGLKSDKGGSTYIYSTGTQPNGTQSIGNWNTGGSPVGIGDSRNVYNSRGERIGGSARPEPFGKIKFGNATYVNGRYVQSGPIPPALGPQGLPQVNPQVSPVVAALANRLQGYQANPFQRYQTPAPSILPRQYGPRAWDNEGQYGGNNPAMGFSLANFNNQGTWGGAQQTNVPKNPNGGGYTNVNKNGGGYGYNTYGGPR